MSIVVEQVTKTFGEVRAVHGVSLQAKGEIYGLLGNNGAGKSTLLKMMTGILPPDRGEIRIGGYDVQRHPLEAKRSLGFLPEDLRLYPRLTPREFLDFIGSVKASQNIRQIDQELEYFQLTEKQHLLMRDLSLGMKKKVGLIAALLGSPSVILLDEPLNGLDVHSMERLSDRLRGEVERGATVVLSSHNMEFVDRICHRVGILVGGTMKAQGTPQALKRQAGGESASFHDCFLYFTQKA